MVVEQCFRRVMCQLGLGKDSPVVLGVSGGVDSMVLLYLCWKAELQVVVAHMNYMLRGAESDADARLVADYARQYCYPFVEKKINLLALSKQKSIETIARNLRYDFFQALCIEHKSVAILTAHNAEDNVETVFLNFLRPTGLLGLAAIPYKNANIVRPLLDCPKAEIYAFAQAKQIEFQEDRSNQESIFLRNFLRNRILPALAEKIPNLYAIIGQNIRHYQETYAIYQAHITVMRAKYLRQQDGIWLANVDSLKRLHPLQTWIYELFSPFVDRARQIDAILQLLDADSGKYLRLQNYEILRHKRELQVIPRIQASQESYPRLISELPWEYSLANKGRINLELVENLGNMETFIGNLKANNDYKNIYLDAKELQLPLLLRPLRTGDYYYPLGLAKKKKILRIARDAGWRKVDKMKIWVLEAANGHIVWVWGLRPDERYKLRLTTKKALKIQL